jgi:2-iminobutanoate/2-iminopropanoate deaminase
MSYMVNNKTHTKMKKITVLLFAFMSALSTMSQSKQNFHLINPNSLAKSPAYSHIAEIKSGRIVLIAGQVSMDSLGNVMGKGDLKAQTEQVYQNIEKALKAVGAGFADVAKFGIYIKDMGKIAEFREVRNRLFDEKYYKNQPNRPVSTAIGVTELFNPDWLIEIEAFVVLPN